MTLVRMLTITVCTLNWTMTSTCDVRVEVVNQDSGSNPSHIHVDITCLCNEARTEVRKTKPAERFGRRSGSRREALNRFPHLLQGKRFRQDQVNSQRETAFEAQGFRVGCYENNWLIWSQRLHGAGQLVTFHDWHFIIGDDDVKFAGAECRHRLLSAESCNYLVS